MRTFFFVYFRSIFCSTFFFLWLCCFMVFVCVGARPHNILEIHFFFFFCFLLKFYERVFQPLCPIAPTIFMATTNIMPFFLHTFSPTRKTFSTLWCFSLLLWMLTLQSFNILRTDNPTDPSLYRCYNKCFVYLFLIVFNVSFLFSLS